MARNSKDLWAGAIFVLAGAGAVVISRGYPMGTAARMGPGYFPTLVGGTLALLGVATMLRAWRGEGERVPRFALRPLLLVLGAVVVFAYLAPVAGLAVAAVALVALSRVGGGERHLGETGTLAAVLAGLAVAIFVYGLKLPLQAWPW